MIKSLYTAATGMKGQQTYVDAISNNLANVNTTGFKRSEPTFQDLLYVTMKAPGLDQSSGTSNPTGIQVGSGSKIASTTINFTPGVLEGTNRNLDVAITGPGFFRVNMPDGSVAYTRDGHFQIDSESRLTTNSGLVIQPEITIPPDTVSIGIAEDGQVTVTQASAPDVANPLGRLELTRFVNPSGLNQIGGNLYLATQAAGTSVSDRPGAQGMGTLQQNFLERSNVEVVSELVRLIVAQRAYEVNSRTIRSSDQMLQQVSSIVR